MNEGVCFKPFNQVGEGAAAVGSRTANIYPEASTLRLSIAALLAVLETLIIVAFFAGVAAKRHTSDGFVCTCGRTGASDFAFRCWRGTDDIGTWVLLIAAVALPGDTHVVSSLVIIVVALSAVWSISLR